MPTANAMAQPKSCAVVHPRQLALEHVPDHNKPVDLLAACADHLGCHWSGHRAVSSRQSRIVLLGTKRTFSCGCDNAGRDTDVWSTPLQCPERSRLTWPGAIAFATTFLGHSTEWLTFTRALVAAGLASQLASPAQRSLWFWRACERPRQEWHSVGGLLRQARSVAS
jgi:hypothetical protein